MTEQLFEQRRKSFEEAFFNKYNQELLEAHHSKQQKQQDHSELVALTGFSDAKLIDKLVDAGINAPSLPALSLFPLVWVAWADGQLRPREKDAVLDHTKANRVTPPSSAYSLLETWLSQRPDDKLWYIWKDYIQAIQDRLTDTDFRSIGHNILQMTSHVADADGGYFHHMNVTASQRRILREISTVFGLDH